MGFFVAISQQVDTQEQPGCYFYAQTRQGAIKGARPVTPMKMDHVKQGDTLKMEVKHEI